MNWRKWRRLLALLMVLFVFAAAMPALADDDDGGPGTSESGGGSGGGGNDNTGGSSGGGGGNDNTGGNTGGGGNDNTGGGNDNTGGGGNDNTGGGGNDNTGGGNTGDGDNENPGGGSDGPGGDNKTEAPENPDNTDDPGHTDDPGSSDDPGSEGGETTPPAELPDDTETPRPERTPRPVDPDDDDDDDEDVVYGVPAETDVPTPRPTTPPMRILLENYLGDYAPVNVEEDAEGAERTGASPEDAQIVRDADGAAAGYRMMLIPTEGAMLVETSDGSAERVLRLRLSQVRRFTQELGIRTLYFRSGNATLCMPLEALLTGDPAKLVRLLTETYAGVAMELIDLSTTDFAALPIPELSEEELRGYYLEASIAPTERGYEVNVALRAGEETLDLGIVTTNAQLCLHGEGAQIAYMDLLFGMEEPLNTARGNLPSASDDVFEVYVTHFDAGEPWADITREKLTPERVSGMVVNYAGYGEYGEAAGDSTAADGIPAFSDLF